MSLRPFRNIERKKTKVINVGDVKIGGNNSSIGPQTSDKDKKPSTGNVPVAPPKQEDDTGKKKHTGPKISNKEAENYLKGLGVGAGGSTSNVGIDGTLFSGVGVGVGVSPPPPPQDHTVIPITAIYKNFFMVILL